MLWIVFAGVLVVLYTLLWAIVFVGSDADDRAIAEYERQRRAFEEHFE